MKNRYKIFFPLLLIPCLIFFNFYNPWSANDEATIIGYLNNGGVITTNNDSPHRTYSNPDYVAHWTNGMDMTLPTRYHGSGAMWMDQTKDTAELFCIGGDLDGSGNTSNLVNIYNVTTNSWSLAPPVSAGRFYAFACCAGDSVYFWGGIGGQGGSFANEVNTVDVYSVRTNTMTLGPVLPYTCADARALPYQDSLIYIVGGLINGTASATSSVFLFNRRTATYRHASSLPNARSGFAGVIVGDTIYVACGGSGYSSGLSNTLYIGKINQSDRSLINWSTGTNYPGTSLHRFYAEKWGCKGFITGLGSGSGFGRSTECYVYNTNSHIWQVQNPAPIMISAYFSGSATIGNAGITKWIAASGFGNPPPYSHPENQIYTDSLCGKNPDTTCRLPCPTICINDTTSSTPCFFWQRFPSNLIRYRMQIATDSLFLSPIYNSGLLIDTFKCMSPVLTYNYCYYLKFIVQDTTGSIFFMNIYRFHLTQMINVAPIHKTEPDKYMLYQNYPNPFNPVTKIKFDIPSQNSPLIKGEERSGGGCQVSLIIYDLTGREVATLVNRQLNPGTYEVEWPAPSGDASNFATGIYFYKLIADDFVETKKMVLMK